MLLVMEKTERKNISTLKRDRERESERKRERICK